MSCLCDDQIFNQIKDEVKKGVRHKPYLIGVSGGSGGGKTSVANLIQKSLGRQYCLLFSMDTYYKDLTPEQEKDLENYNFDSPEALDLDLLYQHLNDLMHWKSIEMPTYDFATNKRQEATIKLLPCKVIIFEGILAFYDKRMRDLMDLKLFVDLDDDIRLSRRIYRDIISRGRQMETVLDRYHKFVKTAYNNFIKPTKEYADIIIPRGGSNTVAIDLINYHLKYLLNNILFKNDKGEVFGKRDDEKVKESKELGVTRIERYSREIIDKLEKADVFTTINEERLVEHDEEDMFLEMFKNYLKCENYQYFDLYMDIYVKKIRDAIGKDDLVIFSIDDRLKIESNVKEKIKHLKDPENECFDIFFFVPIFLDNGKDYVDIVKYLLNIKQIRLIKFVSIFACNGRKEIIDYSDRCKLKAVYSGNKVPAYCDYINNFGFYCHMDDEDSNNLISFSEDNFERRLLELKESENKKDILSVINNYQEDE